jgi:hypothetical protein
VTGTIIARDVLIGQRPDEEPFTIAVEIGTPYRTEYEEEVWACPMALDGLHDDMRNVHGGSALQVLCLATGLAYALLRDFLEDGGTLSAAAGGRALTLAELDATFGRSLLSSLRAD